MDTILNVQNLRKAYHLGDGEFWALRGVSFDIEEGEMTALTGPSGSGKSTLMHILGLLDKPTEGRYLLRDQDVTGLSENERARVRNREIGFVFQSFHLLPRMSVLQNVEVPLTYAGYPPRVRRRQALEMLEHVGLADKATNTPAQLSGGQRQRVAIARALSAHPAMILADEPTGNLDTHTGDEVMELFKQLNAEGVTVVIVTHEADIAAQTRRTIQVRDGLIESDREHGPVITQRAGPA